MPETELKYIVVSHSLQFLISHRKKKKDRNNKQIAAASPFLRLDTELTELGTFFIGHNN